jgi:hypothetical protein
VNGRKHHLQIKKGLGESITCRLKRDLVEENGEGLKKLGDNRRKTEVAL